MPADTGTHMLAGFAPNEAELRLWAKQTAARPPARTAGVPGDGACLFELYKMPF